MLLVQCAPPDEDKPSGTAGITQATPPTTPTIPTSPTTPTTPTSPTTPTTPITPTTPTTLLPVNTSGFQKFQELQSGFEITYDVNRYSSTGNLINGDEVAFIFEGVHYNTSQLTVKFQVTKFPTGGNVYTGCPATPQGTILQEASVIVFAAYNKALQNNALTCLGSQPCYYYYSSPYYQSQGVGTDAARMRFSGISGISAPPNNLICVYATLQDGNNNNDIIRNQFFYFQ